MTTPGKPAPDKVEPTPRRVRDLFLDRLIDGICPHCGKEGKLLGLYEHVGGLEDVLRYRCAVVRNKPLGSKPTEEEWAWDTLECWRRWDAKARGWKAIGETPCRLTRKSTN